MDKEPRKLTKNETKQLLMNPFGKLPKEKKHRHKWEVVDYVDCPKCGFSGEVIMCECGEEKE